MEKYMKEWEQICKEFCKQNNYELLFVNVDSFGFEDTQEQLHHVYCVHR